MSNDATERKNRLEWIRSEVWRIYDRLINEQYPQLAGLPPDDDRFWHSTQGIVLVRRPKTWHAIW